VKELDEMVRIAVAGCAVVNRHYAGAIHVEYKEGDDPVTAADRETNELVCRELERAFPGVPIVAEESDESTFDVRRDAAECFFVDPLDGTREFVKRNGEFAVMIGLARAGRASLGVVAVPVSGRIFAGGPGVPSFELASDGARRAIHTTSVDKVADAHLVISRSRSTDETFAILKGLGATRIDKLGSAGLKAAAVACGEADLWLQPTQGGKLWDSCGPEAVVLGAGGSFGKPSGDAIDYAVGPLALEGILVAATRKLFDTIVAAS
jgi:3'(2'), 5'-bisphosphate nucleotidase